MSVLLGMLEPLFGPCTPDQRAALLQRLATALERLSQPTTEVTTPIPPAVPNVKTLTGTISSSGIVRLLDGIAQLKYKVCGYCFTTTSTTAVTITIYSGGARQEKLWQLVLQAPATVSVGANLAVPAPSYLFKTDAFAALDIGIDQSVPVTYSLSYFDCRMEA